jgi:hypothetical protein
MKVGIIETRQHRSTLKVDDLRIDDGLKKFDVGTDSENLGIFHKQGFGETLSVKIDFSIIE